MIPRHHHVTRTHAHTHTHTHTHTHARTHAPVSPATSTPHTQMAFKRLRCRSVPTVGVSAGITAAAMPSLPVAPILSPQSRLSYACDRYNVLPSCHADLCLSLSLARACCSVPHPVTLPTCDVVNDVHYSHRARTHTHTQTHMHGLAPVCS